MSAFRYCKHIGSLVEDNSVPYALYECRLYHKLTNSEVCAGCIEFVEACTDAKDSNNILSEELPKQ